MSTSGLNVVRPPTVASIRTSYLRSNVPWLNGTGVRIQEMTRISELQPTHRQTLSNRQMDNLINDIRVNGISEPIKYVLHNGQKYVVDGHHRLIAARRLGIKEVPTQRVEIPFRGYITLDDLLWFD